LSKSSKTKTLRTGSYKTLSGLPKTVVNKGATFRVYKIADRAKKSSSVVEKRVSFPEGNTAIVRAVDANTVSFGTDLRYVFERNVDKALRENKRTKSR
jgi:hypothetical protein